MEKIIQLGDIHGRGFWETVKKHKTDRFIFVGDYFDSFDINFFTQMENFKEIIKFKRSNPDKVVLLLGNHDYHYLNIREHYSGYQDYFAREIENEILKNIDLFKIAHIENFNGEKVLYSHAGVTKTWCTNNGIDYMSDKLDTLINDMFLKQHTILEFVGSNPYGDSIISSPIWVRPNSLMKDAVEGYTHVMGHTTQNSLTIQENGKNKFIFIDLPESFVTLSNNGFEEKRFKDFWHAY